MRLDELVEFRSGKKVVVAKTGDFPVWGSNGELGFTSNPLHQDAVVLGRVGAYCGSVRLALGHFSATDNTILASPKSGDLEDLTYLAFLLECLNLNRFAGGSAQPLLTQKILGPMTVPWPNTSVRTRVSFVGRVIDSLLANNLGRIEILEEMARLLYQEWFVNFKFPEHENVEMVDSELGLIPAGWEVKALGEVSQNYDRLRRPLSKIERSSMQGPFPYYGAAKVVDYVDDFIFDGNYLLVAEDGTVITSDGNPVLQLVKGKFWVNNHTHVLQGLGVSTNYLWCCLARVPISGYVTGSAQPKINQANLNRIRILVPEEVVASRFEGVVGPIVELSFILSRQNRVLREIRDLLLPRLISGEIDVSELDLDFLEEVS